MKPPHDDILNSLGDFWKEWSGSNRPITAEGNIVEWLQREGWWREIDVTDLRWTIARRFGANIPKDVWHQFFCGQATSEEEWTRDVAPTITFGRLTALIQRHLADVSFAPINVAGKDCAAAGAFMGFQRLAEFVDPHVERFGPSTRIRDRLSGDRLVAFWSQLRLFTRNSVRPVRPWSQQWRVRIAFILAYCLVPGLLVTVFEIKPGWSIGLLSAALTIPLIIAAELLDASAAGSPPKGIRTFRDLAIHVSHHFDTPSLTIET